MMNETDPQNELHLTESQVRSAVAIILVVIVFLCVMCYHWGKKKAYEEFVESSRSEELSDKISMALCRMNEGFTATDDADDETADSSQHETDQVTPADAPQAPSAAPVAVAPPAVPQKNYHAVLAGFGTRTSAQQYQKKLEKRGITADVVQRSSKSGRGKTRTWFQVITPPMSHDDLQTIVERVTLEDHLRNVTINEA